MVKVIFHGHACIEIIGNNKKIIIDPFLRGNESADIVPKDLSNIDAILVTHGHQDHVGDTVEIAQTNEATVIAPFELASFLARKNVKTHAMHIGGAHQFYFGWVKMVNALHGSAYVDETDIIPTGNPCGYILEIDNRIIYHSGDTGLFGDLKLIREYMLQGKNIDIAFLPIGDNFTMGQEDALTAVKWLAPKTVVPMHYDTFPLIKQEPIKFKENVEKYTDTRCIILKPGGTLDIY